MHPGGDAPGHMFSLPVELYHQIIFFLDVQDVFALRRTCTFFFVLTQERGLWSMLFARLRATQALPCSETEFTAMSSSKAERVLLAASKVEASFLQLREPISHYIPAVKQSCSSVNTSTCSWRVLSFISERFILSVDSTAVMIWDTVTLASSFPAVATSPWAHFTLSNFLGYVDYQSRLYFAISRLHLGHLSAVIHSVVLPPSGARENYHGRLQCEAEIPLHDAEMLKHMDPSSGRALTFVPPSSMHIVHWRDGNKRSIIPLQLDDLDQGWNGISSLRFCGPYILCFRVRSVEAYPIPTDTPTADLLPLLRHRLGPVCFRAVSLSRVRASSNGDVYTVFMLTNDVYQGMYHYRIRIFTRPVPGMAVDLLAKGSIQSPDPLPVIPGTDVRYTLEDIIRRMFVSTWSVGTAGLRGIWVDRQRGSIDRRVVAFTTHPSRLRSNVTTAVPAQDGVWNRDAEGRAPRMDGKVVHIISSYDLRDDVTICTVSEWTGRIALGSRAGAISLL